ncbi:MAG: hypothetical protein WC459_03585 [Patescibacteria group bacterium]
MMCGKGMSLFQALSARYGQEPVAGAIKLITDYNYAKIFIRDYIAELMKANSSFFASANSVKDVIIYEMGKSRIEAFRRKMWIDALRDFFKENNVRMEIPLICFDEAKESKRTTN